MTNKNFILIVEEIEGENGVTIEKYFSPMLIYCNAINEGALNKESGNSSTRGEIQPRSLRIPPFAHYLVSSVLARRICTLFCKMYISSSMLLLFCMTCVMMVQMRWDL